MMNLFHIFLYIFNLTVISAFCQIEVSIHQANNPKANPLVGFNMNPQTMPSLQNVSFIDSLKRLGVPLLRYPGGTISQYWDWQNGRALPKSDWSIYGGYLQNHAYIGTTYMVDLPLSEYKQLLDTIGAKPLFVLNILTRDISDQLNMLRQAEQIGIQVRFVELGNELYFPEFDFISRFPTAGDYAREMQIWTDSIKSEFPDAYVAIIGTTSRALLPNGNPTPSRIRFWNDSINAIYSYNEGITLHNYFKHNNTHAVPDPISVIGNAFTEWQDSEDQTINQINPQKRIWFTEYNMNDVNQNYKVASTWLHGLYTSIIHFLMLEHGHIEMILNHQITGSAPYASIASYTSFGDTLTNQLTAEGNAMRLIHKAYLHTEFTDKIIFSQNPYIVFDSIHYPSLLGNIFYNNNSRNVIILNTSSFAFNINMTSISSQPFLFETITASNITQTDITTDDLIISEGIDTIIYIPAYSISLLEEISTASFDEKSTELFEVFPNPFRNSFTIRISKDKYYTISEIRIFSSDGKLVHSKELLDNETTIHLDSEKGGYYSLIFRNRDTIIVKKIIKL